MSRIDDNAPLLTVIRDADGDYFAGNTMFGKPIWTTRLADAKTYSSWDFDTIFEPSGLDTALRIARKGYAKAPKANKPQPWVLAPNAGGPGFYWVPYDRDARRD